MHAIMLAAGVGARLSNNDKNYPPKCLLQFDGQSLLSRHIEILKFNNVEKLTLVLGYRENEIKAEIAAIGATNFVTTVTNTDYQKGSILSLNTARSAMQSGDDILFMDADVLYHPDLVRKLISSTAENCIIFDIDFEPGEEPVKVCLSENKIKDFGKTVRGSFDIIGEWPGFVKWSTGAACEIANIVEQKIQNGATSAPYEDAFRKFLLAVNPDQVEFINISGLPWIEIDFPGDLARAREVILPDLESHTR